MAASLPPDWVSALEARHLADLRLPEVARALRALSSAYVERRHALPRGGALDSAGKRAAFALFYAPLHYLVTAHIVGALAPECPSTIVDLGCGTGAAGAAWARSCNGVPRLLGIDRHPWAVAETRWTYGRLRLDGRAKQGDLTRFRPPRGSVALLAAYALNELAGDARAAVLRLVLDEARRGATVLIVEPIARRAAPWWPEARTQIEDAGGRDDEWDLALDLPPIVAALDRAAGLDHRRMRARSLFIARSR